MLQKTSGSWFLTLVLLFDAIFPVWHASATSANWPPVQPQASSSNDIADAVDAMRAGVAPDDALLDRDAMYRVWGSTQVRIHEELFGVPYVKDHSVFLLDDELLTTDESVLKTGMTTGGSEFDVEFQLIANVDPQSLEFSSDFQQELQDRNARMAGVVGVLATDLAEVSFAGVVWQWTRPNGDRVRELVVLQQVDAALTDSLTEWHIGRQAGGGGWLNPGLQPVNCEQAFALADNAFRAAIDIARNALNPCMILAMIEFGIEMGGCAVASVFPAVGFVATAICSLAALGRAAWNSTKCTVAYTTAVNAARIARDAAKNAARIVFGDDCPAAPA